MLAPEFTNPSAAQAVPLLYRGLAIYALAAILIWRRENRDALLRKRFISFLALNLLTAAVAYFGGFSLELFITILLVGCVLEVFRMVAPQAGWVKYWAILMAVANVPLAASLSAHVANGLSDPFYLLPILSSGLSALVLLVLAPRHFGRNLFATVVGAVYCSWLASHMILVRRLDCGFGALVFLVAAVTLCDTLAYTVGRLFGKHKMCPILSPGKTWEGFFGGCLGTLGAAFVFGGAMAPLSRGAIAALTVAIMIAAPLGDLVISALKRKYGAKDTGNILPGHGGLLDRFDSLILAAPIYYYLLLFLRK